MNTELTKTSNAIRGLEGLSAGLANTIKGAPQATDFTALKLKNGRWLFGANNSEVTKKSTWFFDPRTVQHGWICWTDDANKGSGKAAAPLGQRMVPFSQPKPLEVDLPFFADGTWASQYIIKVVCVSGDEVGTELRYQSSAQGMIEQLVKLLVTIEQRILSDEQAVFPVVKLRTTDYNHPQWGQTFKPEFKIVDWLTAEETPAILDGEPVDSDDEPKKKKKKKKNKKNKNKTIDLEVEVEVEADATAGGGETEAPQMRRRRRA